MTSIRSGGLRKLERLKDYTVVLGYPGPADDGLEHPLGPPPDDGRCYVATRIRAVDVTLAIIAARKEAFTAQAPSLRKHRTAACFTVLAVFNGHHDPEFIG